MLELGPCGISTADPNDHGEASKVDQSSYLTKFLACTTTMQIFSPLGLICGIWCSLHASWLFMNGNFPIPCGTGNREHQVLEFHLPANNNIECFFLGSYDHCPIKSPGMWVFKHSSFKSISMPGKEQSFPDSSLLFLFTLPIHQRHLRR